jgi:hypothetical protein
LRKRSDGRVICLACGMGPVPMLPRAVSSAAIYGVGHDLRIGAAFDERFDKSWKLPDIEAVK